MVEEWDLAADKGTKRILIRHCIREIAQALEEAGKENADDAVRRMFVKGRQGVGKVRMKNAAMMDYFCFLSCYT